MVFKMASKMAAICQFHHNFATRQVIMIPAVSKYVFGAKNLIEWLSRGYISWKYPKLR